MKSKRLHNKIQRVLTQMRECMNGDLQFTIQHPETKKAYYKAIDLVLYTLQNIDVGTESNIKRERERSDPVCD